MFYLLNSTGFLIVRLMEAACFRLLGSEAAKLRSAGEQATVSRSGVKGTSVLSEAGMAEVLELRTLKKTCSVFSFLAGQQ